MTHPPVDESQVSTIWCVASWLLLLTLMWWYARSGTHIATHDLAVFLAWLFAVPVVALYIDIRYR